MEKSHQLEKTINILYSEIKALNEKFLLKETHSKIWNTKFTQLCDYAKDISAQNWLTDKIKEKLGEIKKRNEDDVPVLRFESLVMKILRDYREGHISDGHEISFYDFFYYKLRTRVVSYTKEIEAILYRGFKLSCRENAKINRMISFLKKNNLYTPPNKPDLYNENSKRLFIENGICKDMAEVNKLLALNSRSFEAGMPRTDSEDNKNISEDNLVDLLDDEIYILKFLDFLDAAYKIQISKRHQSDATQHQKEAFLRDIITCYYMNVLLKKSERLSEVPLSLLFRSRSFCSFSILQLYEQHSKAVEERIKKQKVITPELQDFINSSPVTLEAISLSHKKPLTYGSRRMSVFRKLLKELDRDENFNDLIDIRKD